MPRLVGRKRGCSYCPYCPQPHPSTHTTWSRPHFLRIIRHCELIYGILEGMYKDLVFEHKMTFMEILSGVAWPSPLCEDGNLDVFLSGTFDDNIRDMHLDRVEALSCNFQALSRFPSQSLETPAAHAEQVSPTAFSQMTVVLQVALYPSSMLWSQSSQRYQADSCFHAHPFIWIKATDFHRECLQASKHKLGVEGGTMRPSCLHPRLPTLPRLPAHGPRTSEGAVLSFTERASLIEEAKPIAIF